MCERTSPRRTCPPHSSKSISARSARAIATGTEFVSTRPRNASDSALATSSAVVPMSMTMVSSGSIRVAASRAMACLRGECRLLRVAKSPSLDRTDRAPP